MSGRLYEAYRRVNTTKRPEHSVALRVAILVSVLIAVAAVIAGGAAQPLNAIAAIVLLPLGAWVSHRRRAEDNTFIKVVLTVGALLALYRFFAELSLSASIDDTREPLANLFLGVQVLHGFDLPQRRDLGFTLASSLALVALAAVGARDTSFILLLIPYIVSVAVSSAWLQRAAAVEEADVRQQRDSLRPMLVPPPASAGRSKVRATTGWRLLRASAPALLVGMLVFLLMPRTEASRFGNLPFKGFPGANLGSSGVVNPGLPFNGGEPPDGEVGAFNSQAYFGFAEHLDLRTVGELSDDMVMRVRAGRPRLWRGMGFDTYTDGAWDRREEDPRVFTGTPVRLPFYSQPEADYDDLVQTFEIIEQTPNLVFAANDPVEIYIAGSTAATTTDGTVTTPNLQEPGTVYSVVSVLDVSGIQTLRAAAGETPPEISERFLQLPPTLPDRVRDLGEQLGASADTPFTKAEAIEDWIGANTEYSLDLAPVPPNVDPVDYFLFERRVGWCEPIASSMVLMLRAAGVPARLATGFQPGDRNPFSGWFEVRMSDAHAWVEAWIPGHGWIAFDPTGAVPTAVDPGIGAPRIALFDVMAWIGGHLPDWVPRVARELVAALRSTAGLLVSVLLIGSGLSLALLTRRRRTITAAAALAHDPFARLERVLADHGVPRDGWQTPREYVTRVRLRRPDLPPDPLGALLAWEESRLYTTASDDRQEEADRALDELVGALAATDPGAT